MRLYKAELYKLCHKKVFLFSSMIAFSILLFYFFSDQVSGEISTVNGNFCRGFKAIEQDKRIVKEFQGELTDDKVEEIIRQFGFPEVVKEGMGGFWDRNYLNDFVAEYLSDGYYFNWNDYKVATRTLAIADTELGEAMNITGETISIAYTAGWDAFLQVLQMGMVLGSILIILSVSVVFAQEGQTKMLPLLFTTAEGKKNDLIAKIVASFTLGILVYIGTVGVTFLLCGIVYGYDGLDSMLGLGLRSCYLNTYASYTMKSIRYYLNLTLLLDFIGLMLLCAITLCISACCRSTYTAVAMGTLYWGFPILLRMFAFGIIGILFVAGSPVFLTMHGSIFDYYGMLNGVIVFSVSLLVACTILGYKTYKNLEVT